MADNTPDSERDEKSARWRFVFLVFVILATVVALHYVRRLTRDEPVVYQDLEEHFKYGSTGGERESGIPIWIWKVLPKMFPSICRERSMCRAGSMSR